MISDIPAELAQRHNIGVSGEAVFVRLDSGLYRDGLRFGNGAELSLQQLPPGVSVELVPVRSEPVPIFEKAKKSPELV